MLLYALNVRTARGVGGGGEGGFVPRYNVLSGEAPPERGRDFTS